MFLSSILHTRLFDPIRKLAWHMVKPWIRRTFPEVRQISTAALAQQLTQEAPVLIDARQPEEYAVSHLPEAKRAQTVAAVEEMNIDKSQPMVVYCSIGYRSSRLAQQLEAVGYSVANLEGSLFQWANEDRPLVKANHRTHQVHPYGPLWGLLLNSRSQKP